MTKKDFTLIATLLNRYEFLANGSYSAAGQRLNMAYTFANSLSDANPRFNHQRFLDACTDGHPHP